MSLRPYLVGKPFDDACGIIQEVGGCWKPKGKRHSVSLRTAQTGVNYMVWLYMKNYQHSSDPIFAFLRHMLNDEQYDFVIRMRDITSVEVHSATEKYVNQVIKTKKETPYVNAIGSLAGQS